MPQNQVCCSFVAAERRFTYAASIAETSSGAVAFLFVLFQSLEGRSLCVCCQDSKPLHVGRMFAQASCMLLVQVYVGTTCYSQGCASLRPVSPCVYSSSRLLPPDYKKD